MVSRAAHTTMSSQKTAPEGASQSELAIRWVFPTSRGMLTRLSEERIVLGRDEACQVRLPGKETSRQHAEICRDGPLHIVKDLGSRNGVFVDGTQTNEAPLALDASSGRLNAAGSALDSSYVLTDVYVHLVGRPVAHDLDRGQVVYAVHAPVRVRWLATGIWAGAGSWSRGTFSWLRPNCAGGRLSVLLESDAKLFPAGQTITAASGSERVSLRVTPERRDRTLTVPLRPVGGGCRVDFSTAAAVPASQPALHNPDTRSLGIHVLGFRYAPPR